ncbi:DoxX family protein [Actinoplanes sp. NPDC049265]|uniref:DoxX family protein n=1 Tax=Actinoplanes sp. NPDC049265 TaxID=3363902 RepID=UPI0037102F2F
MNVVLWVIAAVLAVAFAGSGLMKIVRPKEQLKATGMGWVDGYSDGTVKLIGLVDVLGGLGLVLPALVGIAPILVPIAAVGLVILMIGAIVTHGRRGETPMVIGNLVLLILAAVVAWGRFGPYAF